MTDSADGDAPEPTPLTSTSPQAADDTVSAGSSPTVDTTTNIKIDQPADTPPGPTPGNLDDLSPERLAATGQWTALAALARHGDDNGWGQHGLRQLVLHADDPVAFAWMWATLQASSWPRAWAELSHLPRPLRVPAALVQDVAHQVAPPVKAATHRDLAKMHVLRALDPDDAGTSRIAKAVLARESPAYDEQASEAIRLLGASSDPAVRAAVLGLADAAAKLDQPETRRRAELIAALSLPLLSDAEGRATQDAVDALTESQAWNPAWAGAHAPWAWPLLRRLLPRVPVEHLSQLLNQPWVTSADGEVAAEVFTVGFSEQVTRELLERAMALTPTVRAALVASLARRSGPDGMRLIEHAHRVIPLAELSGLHQMLFDEVLLIIGDSLPRRQKALLKLQVAALAAPRAQPWTLGAEEWRAVRFGAALQSDEALQAWTSALRGGEIGQVSLLGLSQDQLRHLGAALGHLLLRAARHGGTGEYTIDHAEGDVVQVLSDTDDATCALILAGTMAVVPALLHEQAVLMALQTGSASTAVIATANPAPTAAVLQQALTAGSPALPSGRALDVLEAVEAGISVESVHTLGRHLRWKALERDGLTERAAKALGRHPAMLQEALATALAAQTGPAAQRATPGRLRALVRVCIDAPETAQLSDAAATIGQLIKMNSPQLRELAAEWMANAPLTEPLLELVISADEGSARQPSRYASAREGIGKQQAFIAVDPALAEAVRATALKRAARAVPWAARAAAFEVSADAGFDLRLAAAEVLAATPGDSSETPLVEALLAQEEDGDVATLLRQAQRRLASGSLGDALANLVQLVNASPALADLDVAICLPFPKWHDNFITCVDRARAASTEGTESRLTSLILLADLLADQAIAATYLQSAHEQERKKGQLLVDNAHNRPQAGALAGDHSLKNRLPWTPVWAALRADRVAHPAPLGDTIHKAISEAEVAAGVVHLRRIVEGWLKAMYAAFGTPFPVAGP